MSNETTIHVTGETQEEINASFLAAKKHYTPEGEKRPSKGIMNRLYKEAAEARAKVGETAPAPAGTVAAEAVKPASEVDAFLADAPRPRSAAGAKAQHEQSKVTHIRQRVDRNRQAADQAAETVDRAIAEARARHDDPYQTAMRNRREADRKRGPGRKISDEELVELIKKLVAAHPEYKVGQVWEVCMWTEKLAISKGRFDTAWRAATGTEPTRRPINRKAS